MNLPHSYERIFLALNDHLLILPCSGSPFTTSFFLIFLGRFFLEPDAWNYAQNFQLVQFTTPQFFLELLSSS